MKQIPSLAVFLGGLCLLASCQGLVSPEPVTVTFSLCKSDEGPTRADSEDSEILRWALLLFHDGRFADYGLSSNSGPITRTLQAGSYTAYAVANYPEASFHPESFRMPEDLTELLVDLTDNAPGAPVMFGESRMVLPGQETGSQPIAVTRLVCKATIEKISVDFTDPTLASQAFVLKSVFLTNCCGVSRYGSDLSSEEIPASQSSWYNPMGLSGDGFPAVQGIDATITPSTPYLVPHSFLYFPNPTGTDQDTHAETWSPRCTRMVIEATIGNRICYYPITLPAIRRNQTCLVQEVVIRRAGSSNPEQEVPDAAEIVFSASVEPWEQQFNDKDAY